MNFVNRMLVVLQLLFAIALMPILIVLLLFFRQGLVDSVTNMARGLVTGPNAPATQLICVALSVIVFLIAILFMFLELQRPTLKRLKVQEVMGGQVEVTIEA